MNLIMAGRTSLLAQRVKRLPTMRETQVQSLGQEDPLEKDMATHSTTLAWKIPWTEEPGGLQSMGSQRVRHDWVTSFHFTSMAGKEDNWVCVCTHTHTHRDTDTDTHTHKQKWKPDNFPGEFIAGADHVTSSDLQCAFRRDGKIWSQLKTPLISWLILEIPPLLLVSLVWTCHEGNVSQKEENEELRD